MPRYNYTAAEFTDMILIYGECCGNSAQAMRLYRDRYGDSRICPKNGRTFVQAVQRIRENQSLVPVVADSVSQNETTPIYTKRRKRALPELLRIQQKMYEMDEKLNVCRVKDEPMETMDGALEYIKVEGENANGSGSFLDCNAGLKGEAGDLNFFEPSINEYDDSIVICKEEFGDDSFEMTQQTSTYSQVSEDCKQEILQIDVLQTTTDDKQMNTSVPETENVGNNQTDIDKNNTASKLRVMNDIGSSEGKSETLVNRLLRRRRNTIKGDLENVVLKKHATVVSKRTNGKRFSCDHCGYECGLKTKLIDHMKTHADEKRFSCHVCTFKSTRKGSLSNHMSVHGRGGNKGRFICNICNVVCRSKSKLVEHVNSHTGNTPYSCNLCNYRSAQKYSLINHMRNHISDKPFSCNICIDECVCDKNSITHTRNSVEESFSCTLCDYKCKQMNELIGHMRTHTDERPYSCELCDYKCRSKFTLDYHVKVHTGEKPFSCNRCSYKCRQRPQLVQHKKTHTRKNPFSCNLCSYKCRQQPQLVLHMKTHTGEKPFSCELCNYKCLRKNNLIRHMETHREKRFSCNHCSYKCRQRVQLAIHMIGHTDEKPFSCTQCSYKCVYRSYLINHMRTHTGEKPYSCKLCNYKCRNTSSLSSHMKTHKRQKPFYCKLINVGPTEKGSLKWPMLSSFPNASVVMQGSGPALPGVANKGCSRECIFDAFSIPVPSSIGSKVEQDELSAGKIPA